MTFDLEKARYRNSNQRRLLEYSQPRSPNRCHACEFSPDEMDATLDEIERLRALLVAHEAKMDPMAEVESRETDPWSEQIRGGLLPYHIHVNLIDGEPQLPAEISMTWPPEEQEGIIAGTPEYRDYMVWAKSKRDALMRLARLNSTGKEAGRATA